MKTFQYITAKALLIAFLTISSQVWAQEEGKKDQRLNREMTLERAYAPTLQDANKVNTLPEVKQPVIKKMPINYASFNRPINPEKEINQLSSGQIMTDVPFTKKRGYFNLGISSLLDVDGDLGYHLLSSKRDQLNFLVTHRSNRSNVDFLQSDEKVKAKLNTNLGLLNYTHVFDAMKLNLGSSFNYDSYNYYGYVDNYYTTLASTQENEAFTGNIKTNQIDSKINLYANIQAKEDALLDYLLGFNYTNFKHKYGLLDTEDGIKEQHIGMNFGLSSLFKGDKRIGIEGDLNLYNYNNTKIENLLMFDNFFLTTVHPYFQFVGDFWNLELGANVSLYNDSHTNETETIAESNSKIQFSASPNVAIDVLIANKTKLYMTVTGNVKANSLEELTAHNRYVNNFSRPAPTRTNLDGVFGLKCGAAPNFWFNIYAGYQIKQGDLFYFYKGLPSLSLEEGFNQLSFTQTDANLFKVGADLRFKYQSLFDVAIKGVYNKWDLDNSSSNIPIEVINTFEDCTFGRPQMEFDIETTIHPIKKLSILVDYHLATGRETLANNNKVDLKNINDLNIVGTYQLTDMFNVYAKLNNLLFSSYDIYYGYPNQNTNLMLGININF